MPELMDFFLQILRYLIGVAVAALAGLCWKLFLDVVQLKADVASLKQHRIDDMTERNTALTTVQSVKNETGKLKSEFENKIKDLNMDWVKQQNENMSVMKDMVMEIKITLEKMNGAFEMIKDRYEREK